MATIRQRSTGSWQAQVRRRGIVPVSKTFATKADAERWSRLVESEIDRGVFVDRSEAERTSFATLIDRYAAHVTPAKRSARQEALRLKLLRAHFGRYSAAAIRSRHVADFRDARLHSGLAAATVLKDLNTLSQVFETAIRDWGLGLAANPVKLVRRPSPAQGRARRLSSEEQAALLRSCRESRARMLEPLVSLALETGMRLGELLSLRWENVDMRSRVALLPDTKNGEPRRVPLSSVAVAILSALPRHITDPRAFWLWRRSDSLENCWRRAVARAGIRNLHFHDLRHEATSRFFERGLALPEVAAITGHKTWQMLRRYTHLNPADLAKKLG
jgi:integrase